MRHNQEIERIQKDVPTIKVAEKPSSRELPQKSGRTTRNPGCPSSVSPVSRNQNPFFHPLRILIRSTLPTLNSSPKLTPFLSYPQNPTALVTPFLFPKPALVEWNCGEDLEATAPQKGKKEGNHELQLPQTSRCRSNPKTPSDQWKRYDLTGSPDECRGLVGYIWGGSCYSPVWEVETNQSFRERVGYSRFPVILQCFVMRTVKIHSLPTPPWTPQNQ